MSYHTYITDALVCGSRNSNTSDRSYLVFTRDIGMLWANARSVRVEKSKNRYALQDFSRVRLSLVRGRAGWRITSAEPSANIYWNARSRGARTLVRNTLRLLRRFIHGETAHPELFEEVIETLIEVNGSDTDMLEKALILRVLHQLGYVAPKVAYERLLTATTIKGAVRNMSSDEYVACSKAIEHAFEMSHL